jgi:ATP-dependent Lon protease
MGAPLSPLDAKVRDVFGEAAVLKGLVRQAEALRRVPRFVAEYLLGMVAPDTPDTAAAISRVEAVVSEHCPLPEDRELLKHYLLTQGQLVILDSLTVRVDLNMGMHWATVPALGEQHARLDRQLALRHPGLLQGGQWGRIILRYDQSFQIGGRPYPVEVVGFAPLEGRSDLGYLVSRRPQFTLTEWIELMLASAGYAPPRGPLTTEPSSLRSGLLLLSRLLPLVEPNINIIELGPKNTGKTYLLRNVSPHAFVISGGQTTPANLFVNLATRRLGVIGYKRAIVFDEIGKVRFFDPDGTIPILKDFMESGNFSRGRDQFSSDASIVLLGNISVEGELPDSHYAHLLEELPPEIQDSAFVDRIHGFIPGWEIPKLTPSSFTDGFGLLTDYFAEVLNSLRAQSFSGVLSRAVAGRAFLPGVTRRDQVALERISRGLLKLVHPDGEVTPESAGLILSYAAELRQRVHNQLTILDPGEYGPRAVGWEGVPRMYAAPDFAAVLPISDRDALLNTEARIGEVTALTVRVNPAGEAIGGSVQLIEVSALERGHGGFEVVGKHDPDMEDSARAAYNFVLGHAHRLGVPVDLVKSKTVAVHLVSIGTPREGPSAGLAFLIAIVSAITGVRVRPALAVTGEVSLHGRVTGVSGITHKLRAAQQHGRRTVIIPGENEADLNRVPPDVLSGIDVTLVDSVEDALRVALGLRG